MSASGGSEDVAIEESGEEKHTPICWICQTPIDSVTSAQFRGKPIHFECFPSQ